MKTGLYKVLRLVSLL